MKRINFKLLAIIFFLLSFLLFAPHLTQASGYDVCGNRIGWSYPQSSAQKCGWGYWHSSGPKYGYVQDCCCCFLKYHIHDLGQIFKNKRVLIEYQPGWGKGCSDTMTAYASSDNHNWRKITSHRVTQPTWDPKTTFQEKINVYGEFRYIKISIPHCYNDYSSARVIGDLSPPEDPIEGVLSASETSKCIGETITFTISAQDDQGINKVCLKKENGPEICKFCDGETSCTKSIETTENNPGTYKFYGILYGKKTDSTEEIGKTNPEYIDITFNQCCDHHSYKRCCQGKVYWFDSCGNKEDLFQDCGESHWTNDYRCSGNTVQRKWVDTGCEDSQCFTNESWEDIEDCSAEGKICQNGQCVAQTNHPASGTLSADKESLDTGEKVRITIEGSDEDGINSLCLFYQDDWHCQNVSGQNSSFTWEISETNAGSYNYCGKVKGKTPEGDLETVDTNPSCITITFNDGENENNNQNNYYYYYYYYGQGNHLGCYNNDVYWFDQYGQRKEKYQECGESYYSDWSQPYCKGNAVYEKRTYYQKGCENGSCFVNSQVEEKLLKKCSVNQICENGECQEKITNQCQSGPCCENGHFKSSESICDVQFQTIYGCPWGQGCGYDVGKRTRSRFRYCSGNSAQCTGNWGKWGPWTPWQVSDYCSFNEACSVGKPTCQYNPSCTSSSYIKHYSKTCSDNALYWVDSKGRIQDLYRKCDDNNTCTIDRCEDSKCINELYCNGTTCAKGSPDYCSSCNHCGDGICNCQENEQSCPQDCSLVQNCISGFARKADSQDPWQDNLTITQGEELEFLFSLCNNSDTEQNNVVFKINLPKGISFEDDVEIDGNPKPNIDLEKGINLQNLSSHSRKTITFKAKVNKLQKRTIFAAGIIVNNNREKTSFVKLNASSLSYLSILASIIKGASFWKWSLWFFFGGGVILSFFLILYGIQYFMRKRDEKHKQMILEIIGKKK